MKQKLISRLLGGWWSCSIRVDVGAEDVTNVIEATQDQDSRIEAQCKAKQNKGEKRRLGREREAQEGNSDQKKCRLG